MPASADEARCEQMAILGVRLARGIPYRVLVVCAVLLAAFPSLGHAEAQKTDSLPARKAMRLTQIAQDASRLSVPTSLVAEPSSSVALRISVPSPRDLPPNSFLRIRGLPPALALTDGYAIAPGVWAVPLAALSNLRVIVPVGVSGNSEVTVSLVAVDGAPIAEAKLSLSIAPPATALPPSALSSPAAPRYTTQPILSPEAREKAERLVQRGDQELKNGNVAQARGFFMRAADSGLAQGALMLASTYDPAELSRLKVQGVQPNPIEARKWYERARELGAPEANDRLTALSKR